MKSFKTVLLSTIIILCFVSCKNSTSHKKFDKLDKMNWLLGHWEQKLPDGTLTENWEIANDSTFTGQSYFITSKDTVHFESIQLIQKNEELIYNATVQGQNNDEPVSFKQTSDAENVFTFENPKHDYPQKIVYKKINDTNLIATISGKQLGKESQESYPMKKK
ncbi:DUF6265 family protein [Flavobacterium sp. N1994]|uniref:DUF6265 family protein n=1 Tax=Flavobacterium sp. N1994 TaxID=2986827 RepID=UPI0022227DED|nr:DUF6265 family protein [Flavobacterium sp. N1994]